MTNRLRSYRLPRWLLWVMALTCATCAALSYMFRMANGRALVIRRCIFSCSMCFQAPRRVLHNLHTGALLYQDRWRDRSLAGRCIRTFCTSGFCAPREYHKPILTRNASLDLHEHRRSKLNDSMPYACRTSLPGIS
jgi:hypothetical protein